MAWLWVVFEAIGYYVGWGALADYIFVAAVALYSNYQTKLSAHKARQAVFSQDGAGRKQMVRQPITPRVIIYGQANVSGPITFLHVDNTKTYLYMVITLSGHELYAIDELYFNEDLVRLDADGTVTGKYASVAVVKKGLGSTAGDAGLLAFLTSELPTEWTANHRQSGCGKLAIRLKFDRDLFPVGLPNISAVVRGKKTYDPRDAQTRYSNNAVLCLRDYFKTVLLVTDSKINDTVWSAEANICDEAVGVKAANNTNTFVALPLDPPNYAYGEAVPSTIVQDPTVPLPSIGLLLGDHFYYKVTFTDALGETTGSPESLRFYPYNVVDSGGANALAGIPVGPSGVTSRKIYRSDSGGAYYLAGTISDNTTTTFLDDGSYTGAALPTTSAADPPNIILRDTNKPFLRNEDPLVLSTTGTLPAPLAPSTTYYYIYVDALSGKLATSSANARAGTAINITDLGSGVHTLVRTSERRFCCDGTVETDILPREAIGGLMTSFAGKVVNLGGQWQPFSGSYRTPSGTLTVADLDGPITTTTRLGKRDLCNRVKGTFMDPANSWQPTDAPPVTNATYLSEDQGEPLWKDVQLPFSVSPSACQRIFKILLEENRQQIVTTWPCKLTVMRFQVGDVVTVIYDRWGWTSVLAKKFEIVNLDFVVRRSDDVSRLGIDLTLHETASGVYDWANGEETTIDLSPNTALPSPFDIDPPAGLVVASGTDHLAVAQDGTVFTRAYVSWTPITDEYVRSGGTIEVQYRMATSRAIDWEKALPIPGTESSLYILDVKDRLNYLFRARTFNGLVRSAWSNPVQHTIIGKTEPPPDVDTFSVQRLGDGTRRYSWAYQNSPADLAGFVVRYRPGTGYTWDEMYPLHTGVLTASPFESNTLAAGTYTLGIKAIDTTGNLSLNATYTEQTLANPRLGGSILEVNLVEEGWPGTKTNCWADEEQRLWISDSMTWNNFESAAITWAQWTSWAMAPYLTATYDHTIIDLGTVYTYTPLVSVFGNTDYVVEESHSTDGVTYTGYDFTGLLITARYIKIRVTLNHP